MRIRPRHPVIAIIAVLLSLTAPGGAGAQVLPELPRAWIDVSSPPRTARTVTVPAGGDLQAAIDGAEPGDVIALEPGATFTGNFTLPAKSGDGWIVIHSAAPDRALPLPGSRIAPADAGALPKIVSPNAAPAVATAAGAHHYWLLGLEVTVAPGVAENGGLVLLGRGTETDRANVPHDIVLDRVYVHGQPGVDLRRAVALNGTAMAVIDSHLSEAHHRHFDAQAICGWNGPGPFLIDNNYLEGSGENLMFGGADPAIQGLVPADIEIRGNHFAKPLSWRAGEPEYAGVDWSVKNLLELKNARRVLIEGNVFEHNWGDAQNGMAILFTVRNQDGGAPWSVVEDVTFTRNVVRRAAGGISVLGLDDLEPSQRTERVLIRDNLFEEIDGARWGGGGRLLQVLNGAAGVVFEHNTALQSGSILAADLAPSTDFVFRDNITADGGYGVVATGGSLSNLAAYFPGAVFARNAVVGGRAADFPADNFFPESPVAVAFADPTRGDYTLARTSPYRGAGTDGRDLGADIAALAAATAGVVSGTGGREAVAAPASPQSRDALPGRPPAASTPATARPAAASTPAVAGIVLGHPEPRPLTWPRPLSDVQRNTGVAAGTLSATSSRWSAGPSDVADSPVTSHAAPLQAARPLLDQGMAGDVMGSHSVHSNHSVDGDGDVSDSGAISHSGPRPAMERASEPEMVSSSTGNPWLQGPEDGSGSTASSQSAPIQETKPVSGAGLPCADGPTAGIRSDGEGGCGPEQVDLQAGAPRTGSTAGPETAWSDATLAGAPQTTRETSFELPPAGSVAPPASTTMSETPVARVCWGPDCQSAPSAPQAAPSVPMSRFDGAVPYSLK